MDTVISEDGTKIAYDNVGKGPVVILMTGALTTRLFWSGHELAKLLAPNFTVISYDRRGRGDSTNTLPYSPMREIEDIQALIDQTGGSAFLYGHSSGGALAIEAAIELGKKVKKLAVYEVPYNSDENARKAAIEYSKQLTKLLAEGNKGDAVELFMKRVGMPDEQIQGMRHAPVWQSLEALAPTLAYDNSILGEDNSTPRDRIASINVPTLIMAGGAGSAFMRTTALELQKAIPNAQLTILKDQTHEVNVEILSPVLGQFFSSKDAG